MTTLSPYVFRQELDNNGNPLSGGKIYTYEAGTTTPKATYTDSTGNTANANPVILDSAGRASIWLGDGGYKFVLKTSADVTISTVDNIGGSSDTAFGGQVNALSSNTIINSTYQNSVNVCTGTFTLSLLAVADAGEGFYFIVKNQGSGVITIDPDTSEQVDGVSSITIGAGLSAVVICNGSAWYSLFLSQIFPSGILKGSGTNTTTAAVQGTDYYAPGGTDVAVADGGTNISSYTAGDTLYASAGTTLSKLAIGSTGRPMVSTGTAPNWGNAINLQASSSASGSTVENTSVPSGVRRIKIYLAGLSTNGTSAIQVQIGSGSYETTGYTGSVTQASASVASSNLASGFAIAQTVSAASVFSGIITLEHMGSNLWSAFGMLGRSDAAVTCYFGGHKSISGVLDRIRINCGADTFDAGTVAFAWEF